MAACAYCDKTLFFGGTKRGSLRFCNHECEQRGTLAQVANQLSSADVALYVGQVHRGNCPKCKGPGPVDVHTSHRVWSALVRTSWVSRPMVGCKACGTRQKLGDAAFSLALGWWAFPWGVLMTPVQVGKNLFALAKTPDPLVSSPELEKIVRLHLARQLVDKAQHHAPGG